jgi:hypothetical protein
MIDTLIASVDIENYDDVVDTLIEKLEVKKIQAKNALSENTSNLVTIELGDMTFEVLPNGKKGYAYILHNDFYEIDIAQYRNRNFDFYPIFFKIKSNCLWSYGPLKAWQCIYNWITENIGDVISNKLSRIDLCCHTDEFLITEDDISNFKGRFYTETIHKYRRRLNAMTYGSSATGRVYCRIYDKHLEVVQKKVKNWFFDIWRNEGLKPEKVWNVEFQLCREFLTDYHINTIEDAFASLKSIWEYCTKNWLVKIELDNDNISRCSVNKKWKAIQAVFDNYESRPLIKREKQLNYDAQSMIPSTFGNITTYAAKVGMYDPTLVFRSLSINGERYLKSKKRDFKKVVAEKESLLKSDRKYSEIYNKEAL